MKLRVAFVALALLAGCSPPAQSSGKSGAQGATVVLAPAQSIDPAAAPLIAILTPAVAEEIGQPVLLQVTTARLQDAWGWVVAQPRTPDGGQIDWSQTKYASRAEAGDLDGDGTTYALLQQQSGVWVVRQFVIGPQDVAYMHWPERYGAPPALMGLEAQSQK